MANNILDILPAFRTLAEFREFLEEQEPQINDGEQISKGKDENERSKEEKEEERETEQPQQTQSGETEQEGPTIDPTEAPGSQVAIGKKVKSKSVDPKAKKLALSGKKTKVEMKPSVDLDTERKSSPYGAK